MTDPMAGEGEPQSVSPAEVRLLLERQRDLLTAVATGTSIETPGYQEQYRERRSNIQVALKSFGLTDPYPWHDLWQWWAYIKQWKTYMERRVETSRLIESVLDQLDAMTTSGVIDWHGAGEATWPELERRLDGLKQEFDEGHNLDDWQDVGRRAREIVIDAADVVFDEPTMVSEGEEPPKTGDAKARLDRYLETRVPGRSHAELRRLMHAAWDVAQKVTHSSGVSRSDAFAAAQAAVLVVRTLEEIEATQS